MSELRPADPVARRRALIAFGLVTALALLLALALPALQARLEHWVFAGAVPPAQRLQTLLRVIGVVTGLLLLAPAAYAYLVAARIDAAEAFPPPGMKLVRETRVVRGGAARTRARVLRALAIALAVFGCVAAVVLWRLAGTLSP